MPVRAKNSKKVFQLSSFSVCRASNDFTKIDNKTDSTIHPTVGIVQLKKRKKELADHFESLFHDTPDILDTDTSSAVYLRQRLSKNIFAVAFNFNKFLRRRRHALN